MEPSDYQESTVSCRRKEQRLQKCRRSASIVRQVHYPSFQGFLAQAWDWCGFQIVMNERPLRFSLAAHCRAGLR